MNKRIIPILFLVLTTIAVFSCAFRSPGGGYDTAEVYFDDSEPVMARSASPADGAMFRLDTASEDSVEQAQENPQEPRLRIYNGSAGLIVEETETSKDDISEIVRRSGGYVERSFQTMMVLRVPADDFQRIFETILSLGRIQYRRVETYDVTEAYADLEGRLSTAESTRERLYILLERSTDPEERARVLREIGRLTEEIEGLRQQRQVLDSQISFSRITLELIPRLSFESSQRSIPFPWIAELDPLTPASDRLRARVNLDLGMNFAVFEKERLFVAESADGISVKISTIDNSPEGDGEYWRRALVYHLSDSYSQSQEKDLAFGNTLINGIEFVSKDLEPYRYFVGVLADGKKLHVIEIFGPDSAHSFDSVYQAMEEGSIR